MIDIRCKSCDRWLGETNNTTIAKIKCSNSKCKAINNIKVVTSTSTDDQRNYVFVQAKP